MYHPVNAHITRSIPGAWQKELRETCTQAGLKQLSQVSGEEKGISPDKWYPAVLSHAQQVSTERLSQWWQVAGRPLSFVSCSFTFFRLQLYPMYSLVQDSTPSIRFGGYKLQDNGWLLKRRGVKGNWPLSVVLALCFSGTLCVSSGDWTRRLQPSSSWALQWGL